MGIHLLIQELNTQETKSYLRISIYTICPETEILFSISLTDAAKGRLLTFTVLTCLRRKKKVLTRNDTVRHLASRISVNNANQILPSKLLRKTLNGNNVAITQQAFLL